MTAYEIELEMAFAEGLEVQEKPLKSNAAALICGNRIALNTNVLTTTKDKACALAEERAHYKLTVGNILDLSKDENRKQEYKARLLAYNERIGLIRLIGAYEKGCHSREDVAEYLSVTPEFLEETIDCYRSKYGRCVVVDNYVIGFIPVFGVSKLF